MTRILSFLGCLILVYSCSTDPKTDQETQDSHIDIEFVKSALARQDEIPVDSIHTVKLKKSGTYIFQGFGRVDNKIRLVKLFENGFVVLDSLRIFQEDYSYGNQRIWYDYKNDWFIYEDVGTGSSDLGVIRNIVRVENERFKTLFSYTKYHWIVDREVFPVTYETIEVKEVKMTKKHLVLVTSYHMEYEHATTYDPTFSDTVTFDFSTGENQFIWKKSVSPVMKEKWWSDKGEYIFRL